MESQFNNKKFQELVLYIAGCSENDARFGSTKLNKLLYYVDFGSYRLLGSPVTGATYRHLPAGPVPVEIVNAKRTLVDAQRARIEYRDYFNSVQERLIPEEDADVSVFTGDELVIIDSVVEAFWNYNARQISEYAHLEWGWRVTDDYEVIPYQSAWVSSEPLNIEQIEHGLRLAGKVHLLES